MDEKKTLTGEENIKIKKEMSNDNNKNNAKKDRSITKNDDKEKSIVVSNSSNNLGINENDDNINFYVGVSEMNLTGLNDLPSLYKILKLISKAAKNIKTPVEFSEPKKIDMEIVLKQLALSIGKADLPPMNLEEIDKTFEIPELEEEYKESFTQVFKPAKEALYLELTFIPKIPERDLQLYPKILPKDHSKYLSLQMAWMMRGIALTYNAPIFLSQVYEHDVYYKKTTAGGWANSFGIGSAGKEPKNK